MSEISVQDLKDKVDSLYRLVIVASRRANQLVKNESHTLGARRVKKSTIVALEEVLDGKLTYRAGGEDEDEYVE